MTIEGLFWSANVAQCMAERDAEIERLRAEVYRYRLAYNDDVRPNRNAIIEECARVVEDMDFDLSPRIAAAIRALKDKP